MDATQPIIVKKIKKAAHGHHGGGWKVAYADFATAMMAFFLLLWLLNSTTEEQMQGVADYFPPTAASKSQSGAGGVLGGTSMNAKGPMRTPTSAMGVTVSLMPLTDEEPDDDSDSEVAPPSHKAIEKEFRRREEEAFNAAENELRKAIEENPELRGFSRNLLIDMTPEGMRIQLIDGEQRTMFPSGSSVLYPEAKKLLAQIVAAIKSLPNEISVIGHTDATPFKSRLGFTNWELSSERAHASRRALIKAGLPGKRVLRVVGKAANEPLIKHDPYAAQNRRISLVLLRELPLDG